MTFDPVLAEIRFGMGLSPEVPAPGGVAEMLDRLAGPDGMARDFPIPTFAAAFPRTEDFREAALAERNAETEAERMAAGERRAELRQLGREAVGENVRAEMSRIVTTQDGLRERLTRFWADHFTVRVTAGNSRHLVSPYVEEMIRPHVAGRFADMLRAAITSAPMIIYLDQHMSIGPGSRDGQRRDRGLNENLARELLELHTLGVGSSYTQADVRELAELLTGLTWNASRGVLFRPNSAEPGPETVLGRTYGGQQPSLEDIHAVLEDLAVHPDTARHIAQKLAVHFIGPDPDAGMVAAMAEAYLASGGVLLSVYAAMLDHPAAWVPELQKVKPPYDFIASSLRALGISAQMIGAATGQTLNHVFRRPVEVMGQPYQAPNGPDGWPEEDEAWITPVGMAGRITWSMTAPSRILDPLPDPREFVHHALGPTPPEPVLFAARAAETVQDGVGVILASTAFQRR